VVQGPRGERAVGDRRGRGHLTALDDLFRAHPSEFVAGRDALAKELRSAGEPEEAARVKKLRRPSAAAWLLNVAALTEPKVLRAFAKASESLAKAQEKALDGGEREVERWRAAAARERESAQAVVDAAEAAAADAGHPATKQALDQVDATLRAAAADAELRQRVLAGRLEREQSGATLGTAGLIPSPGRAAKSTKRLEAKQARREADRLERELAEAEERIDHRRARADEAAESLRRARAQLKEAERQVVELKRGLKAAKRKA
jgi:hypothetical protein